MKPKYTLSTPAVGFLQSLVLLSLFAVALSSYRMLATGTIHLWFLAWNLFLAWVPVLFAWLFYRRTLNGLLWSWQTSSLFAVWLLFLPNAFYLVTDFIHLRTYSDIGMVYDVVLLATYTIAGFVLGYTSLYMVHLRAMRQYGARGHWIAGVALLLSGFAIYLGRYLRWNSWDVITNPLGLLFDVSDRIVNPVEHPLTFTTTLLFFGFLSVLYAVIWRGARLIAMVSREK